MTGKCAGCGKEFPLEDLQFDPEVEQYIKELVGGQTKTNPSDKQMRQLFCKDCLLTKQKRIG